MLLNKLGRGALKSAVGHAQIRLKSYRGRGFYPFPPSSSGNEGGFGGGNGGRKKGPSAPFPGSEKPYSELHFFSAGRTFDAYPLRPSPLNPVSAEKAILDKLNTIMKPREILEYLDRYVIGQSHAKKVIAVAVYNHYCRLRSVTQHRMSQHQKRLLQLTSANLDEATAPIESVLDEDVDDVIPEKSNILLIGPSGCGKTLLAKTISRLLKVPFAMGDATSLTEAGYVGEDVDSLLYRLLENAQFNEAAAQTGIIFLDEVDKIARAGGGAKGTPNSGGGRDVGGEGVQHALLKMLEGTTVQVVDRRKAGREYIQFDTSNLLFVLSGAFVGLEQVVASRQDASRIGFGKEAEAKDVESAAGAASPAILGEQAASWTSKFQTSDIINFGLIPEFIGRVPVLAVLEELDEEALVRTLTEPKNSLVRQYQQLFKMNGVELIFTDEAVAAIGRLAVENKTGARGLRGIMEKLLLPLMFEAPSHSHFTRITIDEAFVRGESLPKTEKLSENVANSK
jgi:ATP-dependent Clp protease ATP-binding subunit ClpX